MKGFGWDYYRALKKNDAQILNANGDVIQKLSTSEIAVGSIVDFFVRFAKSQGSPVDYIVPSEGAVLIPTPIAIVKATSNLPAAEAFVNYLYTPDAQALFVQRSYIPVLPGVAAARGGAAAVIDQDHSAEPDRTSTRTGTRSRRRLPISSACSSRRGGVRGDGVTLAARGRAAHRTALALARPALVAVGAAAVALAAVARLPVVRAGR